MTSPTSAGHKQILMGRESVHPEHVSATRVCNRSTILTVCICAATVAISLHIAGANAFGQTTDAPCRLILTQVPFHSDASDPTTNNGDSTTRLPLGSRVVLMDLTESGTGIRNLTMGFAIAGRPTVSYDGRRVLFVGAKEPDDPLNVWERDIDGNEIRQVTRQARDCLQSIYISPRYSMNEQTPEPMICISGESPDGTRALFTCRTDGSQVRRITFGPNDATDPLQLSDSRLLFSSTRPKASGDSSVLQYARDRSSRLLTVFLDGMDLCAFTADPGEAVSQTSACETTRGDVVFVQSDLTPAVFGSALAAVSRTRSLHNQRTLAAGSGQYESPSPLSDGRLLVSYRPDRQSSFGVRIIDESTGTLLRDVFDAPDWHDVDAVVVRPHRRPPGRSSVVNDRLDHGFLYCLDTDISDDVAASRVQPGTATHIRIIKALNAKPADPAKTPSQNAPASADRRINELVLGEFPIESDGSFHLQVPAETPLRLEMLNASGNRLRTMSSWLWVMPGEARGCIGCHEDREMTPPNRHVLALRRPPNIVADRDRPSLASDR